MDEVSRVGRKPIVTPGYLGTFEYLGYIYGERLWRSPSNNVIYTWDSSHGEAEVFDAGGDHRGVIDAVTGRPIKSARKESKISV